MNTDTYATREDFYNDDAVWDHEFCDDQEPCYNDCPYGHPDEFSVIFN